MKKSISKFKRMKLLRKELSRQELSKEEKNKIKKRLKELEQSRNFIMDVKLNE